MRVQTWLSRDRLAVVAALAAPLLLTLILVPFRASFPNTDAALVGSGEQVGRVGVDPVGADPADLFARADEVGVRGLAPPG